MKKLFLFVLAVLALSTSNLFAQVMIWRNGQVLYEYERPVDSITFIHDRDHSVYDFSTIDHVQERISGLYYQFGRNNSYRNRLACGYQGINTDIEYNYRGYSIENTAIATQYAMTADGVSDLTNVGGNDPWNVLTTLVHEAGLVIDGIRQHCDTTDEQFAYALGEALTLRSYAYLEMIKLWGDIPLEYFEPLQNAAAPVQTPKVDRNIVFERIRADLKRAAELMPWSESCPAIGCFGTPRIYTDGYTLNENGYGVYMDDKSAPTNYTGRPSKAAALALLARADLMYAGKAMRPDNWIVGGGSSYSVQYNIKNAVKRQDIYQEVLWACAQILKNSNEEVKFQTNYEDIFKKICADETTYYQSEVIWEIPFNNGARGQFMNYNALRVDQEAIGKFINTANNGTLVAINAAQTVVPTLYYDFEEGDMRRDVTIVPYKWTYGVPTSSIGENSIYQQINPIIRFYLGKYRIEWMNRTYNNDDGINYPIIRYADVLLMFSEASIGGISGDVPENNTGIDGNATFNKVRARAGLASKTLTMENLMKERAFEFCGEYIRKYDLMRWGLLQDKLVATNTRLQNLAAHTGEFAQLGDSVYYHYSRDDHYSQVGPAFVIDSIWGLNKGETGMPATYNTENGWRRSSIYTREDGSVFSSYQLYEHPQTIDSRQYWPIFPVNLQSSNGNLWNDYGY
ncbi:MAG: RagB/SusD family nutrient uptake outer membrane protein [Paludibacteraceae bacterium]|nr:RagB/SusD family nutrient uptake outer membrane protein [Paludibacteraceae bacterium]